MLNLGKVSQSSRSKARFNLRMVLNSVFFAQRSPKRAKQEQIGLDFAKKCHRVRRVAARHRSEPGARLEGTRISRRIAAFNPDGSFSQYLPKSEAITEVRDGRSDWEDILSQRRIYRRDPRVIVRGKLGIWEPRQSGIDGPLVLQLT